MECYVTDFSDELWHALTNHAKVWTKEDVRFMFKSGMEIKA